MKFKLHVVITNCNSFIRGDYGSLTLLDYETSVPEWTDLGEIEFDLPVDTNALIEKTVAAIDEQIKEEQADFHVRMDLLETRKKELRALPAPDPGSQSNDSLENPPVEGQL